MPHEMNPVLRDFLMESQENLQRIDQELVRLEQEPDNRELLADVFRTIHTIKGSAGFLKLPNLETLAHAAEDVLAKVRQGDLRLTPKHIACILHAVDSLRSILLSLERTGQEGEHDIRQVIELLQRIANGQVPVADLDSSCSTDEVTASAGVPTETSVPLEHSISRKENHATQVETPPNHDELSIESVEDTRVRVQVDVLDHLMNLTGELVLVRNQVVRRANDIRDPAWQSIAQRLHSVVADLQETMLKARMQEIRQVFGLFPRLVHDLSQQHGKDVQLLMDGQKTELDRTLLDGLKEPLIHLIRNAIDHGIEMPAIRRQHGKSPTGTISIRAYHDSGQVHIEVADDGAGINSERIKAQAIALGLLTREQAAESSMSTVLDLIFRPGFSTAKAVTNISGRGVGMDVVKRQLNHLGGVIEIATTPGQGTTFHLRLPMTLAIISGLVVSAHDRQFVIPQQHIEELVRLDQEQSHEHVIYELAGAEVYRLRGELLSLIRLTTMLHLSPQRPDTPSGSRAVKSSKNGCHCEESATKQSPENHEIASACAFPHADRSQNLAMTGPCSQNLTRSNVPRGNINQDAPRPLPQSGQSMHSDAERRNENGGTMMGANPHIVVLSAGDRRFGLFVDNVSDTEEIVVKPLGQHIKQVACYDGATILGDGNVALILNVRGLFTAARFNLDGVQRAEVETHAVQQLQNHEQSEQRQTIVLFTAGHNEYYGVPLAFVERIETFPAATIETSGGREILQYRGEVLPLLRLEPLLHLAPPPETAMLSLIVFAVEKEIGLVVQKVINTVDISTQIDAKRFQQKGVLGSTIVNGLAVLILDIHEIIELAYPQWYQQLLASKLNEAERRQIRVLLVEDSKFFLNIEQSYLTSAGYQVLTAEHGHDALEVLKQQPVDVVVTDIDMPYCNGYELTQAIKTSAEWQHIPVMAVTALSGEEDRQKGIAVGIDEYRIKLDRDEVLRALEQLILRTRKRGDVR